MTTPVGILSRALTLEYLDALNGRLADPNRLKAVWDAGFRAESHINQLQAVALSAAYLLGTGNAALILVADIEAIVIVEENFINDVAIPVEVTFCQHVTDGKPFGVNNALEDLLVCNMDLKEGRLAYLGVPVICRGQVVGSLCVSDTKPRNWTTTDVRTLVSLALTIQELLV